MKTTIDSAGRLVIPKSIREAAGLEPGQPLQIRLRDGRVEIEPEPISVTLERRGRLLVAVAVEPVEQLTEKDVSEVRDAIRDERGAGPGRS